MCGLMTYIIIVVMLQWNSPIKRLYAYADVYAGGVMDVMLIVQRLDAIWKIREEKWLINERDAGFWSYGREFLPEESGKWIIVQLISN